MCECLSFGHDEKDAAVAMIAGHHPACPNFKIDKTEFADRLETVARQIADRMLAAEIPNIKAMYERMGKAVEKPLCENKIQCRLFYRLQKKGHRLIAPNIDIFYTGEMDVCSVMKSGLVNEYEIKLSRADFKKDFKKEHKHPIFEKIRRGIFSEMITWHRGISYEHKYTSPNFYYFVTPQDLIRPEEVPEYAGLMHFNPKYPSEIETVKKAAQLHKIPISEDLRAEISYKLMWRCWTAKDKR